MAYLQNASQPIFQSRAYQLEMFAHSLQANTIVVMGTGTGKTHVASLRIDAELKRSPSKLVWFTAPNAGLVDQQSQFLTSQLPEYRIKSLTGRDNVDAWKSTIWKTVLKNVNIVITTPQVLCDALHHAYVELRNISLLVFDEAHHCQANDPSARIMTTFYHPNKLSEGTHDLPHILGLTASPQISEQSASITQLEMNLDAICRSPTISIDQYTQYLQKAILIKRLFTPVSQDHSKLLQLLQEIVATVEMQHDPYYKDLQLVAEKDGDDGERARQKLKKYERSGQTPAIADIGKFLGNAENLHESLGPWASDLYIATCVSNWQSDTLEINQYHDFHPSQHKRFINNILQPLRNPDETLQAPCNAHVSAKALDLIQYLVSAYHKDIAIIIFVERRAAAWALCRLLQAIPTLACYGIFSYVGLSVRKVAALPECYATDKQDVEFMSFRQGLRNLCIATSVAEEGIDVKSVDVVVRFDNPKQLSSYLQSRGRARCKGSKMVYFQDTKQTAAKYDLWDTLEREMEVLYRREQREFEQRLEYERIHEESNESYRIESTGALLDLEVSVSRLAHFCAKASVPSDPIYILSGETGIAMSAKVLLPSSVTPPLRQADSCRTWRSEKMAKKDAAFHAMKALHEAELINDHLVPFEVEKISAPLLHERKLRRIPAERHVWSSNNAGGRPFAYRIKVRHEQSAYLSLVMMSSIPLQQILRFPLSESLVRRLEISIIPLGYSDAYDTKNAGNVTRVLFEAAFQAGSASGSLADPNSIPCMIIPELDDEHFGEEAVELKDFLHRHSWLRDLQPLLIWKKTRPRPYIWYPPHETMMNGEGRPVLMAKQIRKLQIFAHSLNATTGKVSLPQDKELLLEECEARGIASVYGPVVLLLPSILHYLAAALRAQEAYQTILRSIGLSTTEHVVPALIAKSASGMYNYERLEFLGDACLKYLTSVQMFFDHPLASEGVLTSTSHTIFGNTRLERAAEDVGIAPFITTETASQKHWKLPKIQEDAVVSGMRDLLSKTLADVVESVLGAAYLDGVKYGKAIARCIAALQLFIPEVPWQAPETHIGRKIQHMTQDIQLSILQQTIKPMLGCEFESASLLAEALTHSTNVVSQPALDRLEFIGDAVLDQIVKVKLFEYENLDAGRLTVCRHALVSHVFLAFLTLGVHYNQVVDDVQIDQYGYTNPITTTKRVDLTDLIKFRETSMRESIEMSKTKYQHVRDCVRSELNAGRFPWTVLRSLDAPKVCSDIMESLLAALYIGSQGSLSRCEELLGRLGMMELLEQMATNPDFEVRTPGTMLRDLCAECKIAVGIKVRCEQDRKMRRYIGEVLLGEPGGEIIITRTASCLEEAKSLAEEAARNFLLLLRQPDDQVTEPRSESLELDIDTDTVMS